MNTIPKITCTVIFYISCNGPTYEIFQYRKRLKIEKAQALMHKRYPKSFLPVYKVEQYFDGAEQGIEVFRV